MTAAGSTIPAGARLLHIGPHKTGSTAIQVALHSARDRLLEHGVAYVTAGGYRPRKAGWALGVRGRPSGTPQPPLQHWTRFVRAVDGVDAARVCISNEDFARATPDQVERLVADLGGERVRVVSVVRRLDRYLPSQWQERVKAGDEREYDEWLGIVLDTASTQPDWDRRNVWYSHDVKALVERWLTVVPPEHYTVVVSDETDRSVIPRAFEALLGLPEGFVVPDPSRSNRGLTWAETELIRRVNRLLEDRGVPRPQRRRLLAAGVHREVQERPTPGGPTSPPLPEWAATRLRDLSDQRVKDLHGLGERGVHVVGDPDLMRMPDDVATSSTPLPSPSIDVETAAAFLASALAAIPVEPTV
ncbi:MAG TPA: hypothetical protein VH228_04070 [Nocardioides sp.]|nr:hypothetical protein [Nocardioides sp.]